MFHSCSQWIKMFLHVRACVLSEGFYCNAIKFANKTSPLPPSPNLSHPKHSHISQATHHRQAYAPPPPHPATITSTTATAATLGAKSKRSSF